MLWEVVQLVYKLKSNQNLMSMDSCTSGWGSWKKRVDGSGVLGFIYSWNPCLSSCDNCTRQQWWFV